jgi:hypothetical protein
VVELSYTIQGLGGKYSDPELVWEDPIVPTAIAFLDSRLLRGKNIKMTSLLETSILAGFCISI